MGAVFILHWLDAKRRINSWQTKQNRKHRPKRPWLNASFTGAKETGVALPDVDESGNTPLENARSKTLAISVFIKFWNSGNERIQSAET
jgi:hypothetical protein